MITRDILEKRKEVLSEDMKRIRLLLEEDERKKNRRYSIVEWTFGCITTMRYLSKRIR